MRNSTTHTAMSYKSRLVILLEKLPYCLYVLLDMFFDTMVVFKLPLRYSTNSPLTESFTNSS